MDKGIVELWADIGSIEYWTDLLVYKGNSIVPFEKIYHPLKKRWPQPGFVGRDYFDSSNRVVVMGQNPGVPNKQRGLEDDQVMFEKIQRLSSGRSLETLEDLLSTMREFMLGTRPGRREWGPIRDVRKYIGLNLENIAYLNLVPLCTQGNKFNLKTLQEPYRKSTKLQIKLLKPDKILFYGKVPHDKFEQWESEQWDVCYLERIQGNIKIDWGKFAEVKDWLKS